ncbi:MAG: hypothetical protein QM756_08120 [Polyangiaceae bacterium]
MATLVRVLPALGTSLVSTLLLNCASSVTDPPKGSGGNVATTGGAATAAGGSVAATGGAATATGGSAAGGATTTSSGGSASGGATTTTGGSTASGGTATASGGTATASGGTTASGGAAVGGAANPSAACALTADRIRITNVDVGGTVLSAENWGGVSQVLAISAVPSGGSRVAYMGNDSKVHVVTLDASDHLVAGSNVAFPGLDFVDLYADNGGGVLLLNRDALGGGHLNCGNFDNVCGNAASRSQAEPNACWDMYLVRFDGAAETWATKLTNSSLADPPYRSSATASGWEQFIWASSAYPHRGRIAYDGSNYAAYYGISLALSEACVQSDSILKTGINIHQGDRLTVVGASGARIDAQGIDTACSHSFYQSLAWDPAAKRFVSVCMTDNANRLSLGNKNMAYSTIRPLVAFDQVNVAGGVVPGNNGDYWIITSDGESASSTNANVYLLRFSIASNKATLLETVEVAAQANLNERAPYLAAYGTDGMVVGWETATAGGNIRRTDTSRKLYAQVRSRSTGAAIGDAQQVSVKGNQYQDFRSFPDGSVAFPAPGDNATSVKIMRILPCSG